jgi:tetratricopeptide (TPR) repeat protein
VLLGDIVTEARITRMERLIPGDLVCRVTAMAACANAQRWDNLAGFLHPDYLRPRPGQTLASAAEGVFRMPGEIRQYESQASEWRMVPLTACTDSSDVRLLVEQERAFAWPDGCRRLAVRRLEQVWRRVKGEWFLVCSERVPSSETTSSEAALLPWVWPRIVLAESLLGTFSWDPPSHLLMARIFARLAIGQLRPLVLAARVTIAVDASGLPSWAAEALRRAVTVAIDEWNRSLDGVVELGWHGGVGGPDILIRGWDRTVRGQPMGVTDYPSFYQSGRGRSSVAEVGVVAVQRRSTGSVGASPSELFGTVSHELGHCFGLGECSHGNGVMGPWCLGKAPPVGPFAAERRAVIRWREACHRLLGRAYTYLGQTKLGETHLQCAAELERQKERDALPASPLFHELLQDIAYAPPGVRDYWQGDACLQAGDLDGALGCYDRALVDVPLHSEVLLRRGWVKLSLGEREGLSDYKQAVEVAPSSLYACQCLIDALRSWGHLAEARQYEAHALILARRDELRLIFSGARYCRSPRAIGTLLGRAGVCGARYGLAVIGERIAVARFS